MIKSSRVLNQGYTNYCSLYSGWSVFETLSRTEIPDGWQKVLDLSNKYNSYGGTIPGFFEGLKQEGLNGYKIKDHKILTNTTEIKQYIDKGLPVVCDFTEIFGVPYHTCIAEGYSDTELYIKNSWGTEWGQCGYNWSGLNPQLIRAYVAIPLDQDNNSSGYTGWIMLMPVDRCEVVQPYGKTPFALANPQLYAEFGGIHPGWDFNCPLGTPVYSSDNEDSVVISAGPSGGWGNLIKTQSGNRVLYYAHLNSIVVKVGDTIKRGQLLGYSGNTGNSTGPHLHFGIFLTDLNGFVDPSGYPISSYPR